MNNQKGFTIIELVVVMAVSALVLVILSDVFFNMAQQKKQLLAVTELQENLLLALDYIEQDCLNANAVYAVEAHQLILSLDNGRKKVTYTLANDGMKHAYDLTGMVLYRKINTGQNQPVANFLEQLTIHYYTVDDLETRECSAVAKLEVSVSGICAKRTIESRIKLNLKQRQWLLFSGSR